jgi:hypothetical protein
MTALADQVWQSAAGQADSMDRQPGMNVCNGSHLSRLRRPE